MKVSSAEPHHAGGPGSKKVAEYILSRYESWGLKAWIEEHEAFMPMPTERILELVHPEPYVAKLDEPAVAGDEDTSDLGRPAIDLRPLREAIRSLRHAGESYEDALGNLSGTTATLQPSEELERLNRLLYGSERLLGYEKGLPGREWFKHQIYAPGFKTMPGIREGIEEETWDAAGQYLSIVAEAIRRLASSIEDARATLEKLLS